MVQTEDSRNSNALTPPLDVRESRKRRREWIAIGGLGLLFLVLTFAEFRLTSLSSTLPFVNSIFFFGLLNFNIIILIALVWLVSRNIGKLFIERRRRVLGSRLKSKLVIAFLAFSMTPTLVLFTISALYINSSFDKWFSIKIQNTLQASLEITETYYRNTSQTGLHFGEHLAHGIGRKAKLDHGPVANLWLTDYLGAQRELLALDGVEFYSDPLDERLLSQKSPLSELPTGFPRLSLDLLDLAFRGEKTSTVQHVGSGDLIRNLVPVVGDGDRIVGVVVVNRFIPVSLVNRAYEITSVANDYKGTNPLKVPMKSMYLIILIMITLVILFVAIWVGLFMARELTVPVERLVHGAQAVGAGNLDIVITASGQDEIAVLVETFNKMTRDLRENRQQLTEASADLEKRRLQLEAVLTHVGTGVIVVERNGEITTFNRAVADLLGIQSIEAVGKTYSEVLGVQAGGLPTLIQRTFATTGYAQQASQWGSSRGGGEAATLAATATPLRDTASTAPWGVVVVIDDMTHLIKGQREMAWREVARRIAHEIKNPLTPIKLSAQRLQRRMDNYRGRDGALLQECTDTIIKHCDELKEMVNEFSNFARFPEANPAPHDLNAAIKEVTALFQQAHPQVLVKFGAEPRLPIFDFDRDQIKRVIINLFDNAVSALAEGPTGRARTILLETHYNEQLQMAVIRCKDNGPGMTDDVKGRVFEPYFSTKSEGTGLGLAIAKRIINDHDGFIRVHSAPGEGTEFLIELPTSPRTG